MNDALAVYDSSDDFCHACVGRNAEIGVSLTQLPITMKLCFVCADKIIVDTP